ncbi:MAG: IS630 family transposase [Clostridia bacterium]|nr:IS630 family transposase [Clostridia bacterium]
MAILLDIIEPVEDISLWAMDETGKRLESNNYYSWSPVGKPTVIERNGSHKGLNIIGATEVLNHFDFVYDVYTKDEGTVTAAHIIKFLEKLLLYDKSRGVKLTIVQWDNAGIHKSSDVKQFAKAHESDLVLIHQPPYSPELNPQENMWNWMKKFMSQSSAAKNEQELLNRLKEFKAYIKARPEAVKQWLYARNFFK